MTNHWIDIQYSDRILIIGSNAAENHPISFRWVLKAKEKGAKLISVDPRFTRTSAKADVYAPLRSGTDIAFVNAMINYILQRDLIQRDYVLTHTNASFLLDPAFKFKKGLFGKIVEGKYDTTTWQFQKGEDGLVLRDTTLQDPNCVYQRLKAHFGRYTMELASKITGCPAEKIEEVARIFAESGAPDKSGTIMYAMGTTQHTYGTQNIRAYGILQMLLGNIGVAGGGINALRGESNVQGSTDFGLLFHILPGYLKAPDQADPSLQAYLDKYTPTSADPRSANWWQNTPKYMVSLLKAFWGDAATAENEFGYAWLPKKSGNHSHIALFENMAKGGLQGLIALGQNMAVGGPDALLEKNALAKLDWFVGVDLWETETMAFWQRPGINPADIKTEVFALPAASSVEKEGSVANSGRWVQWRYKAVEPVGEAKTDLWILNALMKRLKGLYAQGGALPEPIVQLDWSYGEGDEPDPHLVARQINGFYTRDVEIDGKQYKKGQQVAAFGALQADGSTCSGSWIYCGSYVDKEGGYENRMAKRVASTPEQDPIGLNPNWAWCWPVNRRIIYNRASCDAKGVPYAPQKAVVAFDRASGKWTGDVPDGPWPPPLKEDGTPDEKGRHAFIMVPDGHACLFTSGLVDGPFPEHYEPLESPVANAASPQQHNPVIKIWRPEEIGDPSEFPIVATTYRVSEHWQAGALTRNLAWLAELCPDPFVEMSEELAAEKGIVHGDMVKVSTKRGAITLRAVVTKRLRPFKVSGKQVHEVGLIWHFGYRGLATGPTANDLTPHVGDANTMIPEYKAFLCDVTKEA